MNGLECSEIMLSNIDKIQYRFDAEFYRPYYINMLLQIESKISKKISSMTIEVNCSAFYPSVTDIYDFNGNGIPFIRVNEIQKSLVNITENTAFLPQDFLLNNSNTIDIVKPMDIVIAKSGNTLAKVGLVGYEYKEYATSRDIVTVHTSNVEENVIYILWAYLSSKYGQSVLWRSASQTGQPHLTLKNILDVDMPAISESIGNNIKLLYERSRQKVFNANKLYKEAEQILLKALNMDNFVPSQQNTTTKSLSQFMNAGRLDAEYFQPKYDEYYDRIVNHNTEYDLVKQCFSHIKTKNDRSLKEYPYVEIGDINIETGEINYNVLPVNELPDNAKIMVEAGDLIISKVRPNRGAVAIVPKDISNLVVSGAFCVLRSKGIYDNTVLQLLFRTRIYKDWLLRFNTGTSYPVIKDDDILLMPIPLLQKQCVEIINKKIFMYNQMLSKSNELLEAAKRAVEIAIEEDEETAMQYLEQFECVGKEV